MRVAAVEAFRDTVSDPEVRQRFLILLRHEIDSVRLTVAQALHGLASEPGVAKSVKRALFRIAVEHARNDEVGWQLLDALVQAREDEMQLQNRESP